MSDEPARVIPGDGLPALVRAVEELLGAARDRPTLIEVSSWGLAVRIEWDGAPSVPPALAGLPPLADVPPLAGADDAAENGATHYVTASMVGVFYRAKEPGAAPFAAVGDHVTAGQQIAIIEAMKLMLPVEADRDGMITEVLLADGDPVEYGTRLFAVGQAGSQ